MPWRRYRKPECRFKIKFFYRNNREAFYSNCRIESQGQHFRGARHIVEKVGVVGPMARAFRWVVTSLQRKSAARYNDL